MLGAHNCIQNCVHNDMWEVLIGLGPLVFTSTTPIKTLHLNCHVIMYKFYVHNYVHLADAVLQLASTYFQARVWM